jgi:glycosyltransferase involved in cell wall biosynthesis
LIAKKNPSIICTDRNSKGWRGFSALTRILCLAWCKPAVIALSASHLERLRALYFIKTKTCYIPNGVNTEIFKRLFQTPKTEVNRSHIVYPAALERSKGHGDLLDICSDLYRSSVAFRLSIAGNGPEERALRRKVHAYGLDTHVTFMGRLPWRDLASLYSTADIGVFPSYSEMMPNALLEMMSAELPVVAYRTGGIPMIIEHGKSGYIVKIGDKSAFRTHLLHLIQDRRLSRKMGFIAREQIVSNFSIETVGAQVASLYSRVC